jgi:hypothetical protein
MRMGLALGAAVLAAAVSAAPAQAQGGEFMWCMAWTDSETGADKSYYYYSAFFAAGAWEADRKAFAFKNFAAKSAVGDTEISPPTLKATCMAPASYDTAVATRNAAMKAGPGKVLSWEGK